MILFFSGTGNSRYIAQQLAKLCEDALVSINRCLNQRCSDPFQAEYAFQSQRPYVIVCPTYCWHLPRVVESFLLDSRFPGSDQFYFVLTCGSGTGQASKHAEEITKKLDKRFMGLSSVRMPENYITLFHAPPADEAVGIIRASLPLVESIAGSILSGRRLNDSNAGYGMPGFLWKAFYRLFITDRRFHTRNACTGCGTCAGVCPLANIRLVNGKPQWQGNCTQCQACIAVCPMDAIEYGHRTQRKRRYYLYPSGRQKFPKESIPEEP